MMPDTPALAAPICDRSGVYTGRVLVLECPYCGDAHEHGVPVWGANGGHRRAHCAVGPGPRVRAVAEPGDYRLIVRWAFRVPERVPRRRGRRRAA